MSDGWTCSGCGREVFHARVWDDLVLCVRCTNLRIFRHEAETPMRGHDADGRCCQIAMRTL